MADRVPVDEGTIGIAQTGYSDGSIVRVLEQMVSGLTDEFEGSAVKSGGGLPDSVLHRAGKIAVGIGEALKILEETVDGMANDLVAAASQLCSSLVQALRSVVVPRRSGPGNGLRSRDVLVRQQRNLAQEIPAVS